MTSPYLKAQAQISIAIDFGKDGRAEMYRMFMRRALGSINQIEDADRRKKFVSKWFSAFNTTNNRMKKEAL